MKTWHKPPVAFRDELIDLQGGMCAWPLCRKPLGMSASVHVDHDHDRGCGHPVKMACPGCVRGAICSSCNTGAVKVADSARRQGLEISGDAGKYLVGAPLAAIWIKTVTWDRPGRAAQTVPVVDSVALVDREPVRGLIEPVVAPLLKWRTANVLKFVRGHVREYGYGPTYAQIASAVGLKSTSSSDHQVKVLREMGYAWPNPRSKHSKAKAA